MLKKRILLLGIFFLVCSLFYFKEQIDLGWGYDIQRNGSDTYITKDDFVIVGMTIIDMQVFPDYLVGLRLPAIELDCDYKPMRVTPDKKIYFILDLDRAVVKEYYVKIDFEEAIKPLLSGEDLRLDYELFENIFKFGKRIDQNERFQSCLKKSGLEGYQVIRLST